MRLVASASGDINNDGESDAVIVLSAEQQAAKGAPRTVLLLVRDPSGSFRLAARNDKLVPCADCGGMFGDPLASISTDRGRVTVVNEGGAGIYWSDEFVFKHVADDGWRLDRVVRTATQRSTAETKRLELGEKDFGVVSFDAFDPESLPEVSMSQ
jgi:hypothetical protein